MKTVAIMIAFVSLTLAASAQVAAPATRPQSPTPASQSAEDISPLLPQVQQATATINLNVGRLRIDKWKADSSVKSQAQSDAESVTRNLTNAFPVVLEQARAHPQSLGPTFRLYRNLDALYEVLSGLTEATGTFGPKGDYEQLSRDAANLGQLRRAIGDRLETLAAGTDTEIDRLRTAAQTVPPTPVAPTKVIVDDQEKPHKAARKKAPQKPAQSSPTPTPTPSTSR